ncbi:unnamed protein product [Didymodactylos carnosus]|uniref:Uncharacterized protein n=1 Tax=Didymodactylos carnosus TaxID=1234261 RepID=A0A8S2UFF4_9BILA|nr:unnamed protein product [Didymodactylos carnosus]CAF4333800.1 unnamed protein product [Didymodactylos carnosus]
MPPRHNTFHITAFNAINPTDNIHPLDDITSKIWRELFQKIRVTFIAREKRDLTVQDLLKALNGSGLARMGENLKRKLMVQGYTL